MPNPWSQIRAGFESWRAFALLEREPNRPGLETQEGKSTPFSLGPGISSINFPRSMVYCEGLENNILNSDY